MKLTDHLANMKMKPRTYFIIVLVSMLVFGLIVPTLISILLGPSLSGPLAYIVYVIPLFVVFVIAILPLVFSSKAKISTDRMLPQFVTEMAALATSDMSFDRILYILSQKKHYGPLADHAKRAYRLIHDYHMSAADACRFLTTKVPSQTEMDFYNRLAHGLEVGERLERFLKNEQDVIMDEYVLKAESTLKDMDFLKELYTGLVTSLIFICVFVSLIPLLGSQPTELLLMGTVLTFLAMEAIFVYFMMTKMPKDDVWYAWRQKWKQGLVTDSDRIMFTSLLVAVLAMVFLVWLLLPFNLPLTLFISTVSLPVLIPGIIVLREERKIEKRDALFGAFVRSVGRSSSVGGQTMADSVRKLSMHKFGALTVPVRNLARRLCLYLNATGSWKHFAAETNSQLINKFSSLYVECVLNGAKAEPTSTFISQNMFKTLAIRKKRNAMASNFTGVLYGIMVALSFTLWVTIGITTYMSDMIGNLVITGGTTASGGILTNIFNANFDPAPLAIMTFAVLVIHAFFSSLILPLMRGGHPTTAAIHFVILIWVGALSSFAVDIMLKGVLM
ncbi:MAG TPA: type II secretion system F family protein [Methanomassiliicoccales archaeon]|nr:type II secretion system F family protein [Methanomassiliicoccales archaeon]